MKSWINVGLAGLSAGVLVLGCGDDEGAVVPTAPTEDSTADAAPPVPSSAPAADAGAESSSVTVTDSGTPLVDADVPDAEPSTEYSDAASDAGVDAEVSTDADVPPDAEAADATVADAEAGDAG